ncbi:MAG: hypothetical protein LUH47_02430 [Clostridiales bacterium]|nr:hypothetical protein [Clostridiales bacterium]
MTYREKFKELMKKTFPKSRKDSYADEMIDWLCVREIFGEEMEGCLELFGCKECWDLEVEEE